MGRTFEALRRAEAERDARRAWHAAASNPPARVPAPGAPPPGPGRAPSRLAALRGWRARHSAREAARAARRTDAAARQTAIVGRLEAIERRIGELDETVTKQLTELEPRLLHVLELRSQGFERELASLALRTEPMREPGESPPPVRALSVALLAWFGLLAFGLGVLFAQSCSG